MDLTPSTKESDQAARLFRCQSDLKEALKEFPKFSTGVKILSERMGVSEKTLRRIVKGDNIPHLQTLLKIYRYLLGTFNDRETLLKMPEVYQDFIGDIKENFSLLNDDAEYSREVDHLLKTDSVFRSIYLETATGTVTKERIGYLHGKIGEKTLQTMVDLGIITEVGDNVFGSGSKRATFDVPTIHALSKFLLENHFYQEKSELDGENGVTLYVEGINKETFNQLLVIDWEARDKKMKLLNNPKNKGPIKAWTFSCTDTLSGEYIYPEHRPSQDKEVLQ